MNKQYFFLCGLPRSGSALLGTILNQNPDIGVYPNSILPDILYELNNLKNHDIVQNFPNLNAIQNIINNIFNNYFEDSNKKFIIDRGPWGTPDNLNNLKQVIRKPKFVILTKPTIDSLASFVHVEKTKDIEKRCDELVHRTGMVGKNLWGINYLIQEKEDYLFIWYKDFVADPKRYIKEIYKFLNIPVFNHQYENFDDYSIDGLKYDDSVLTKNWHKLNTKKIELPKWETTDIIPASLIEKYKDLKVNEIN